MVLLGFYGMLARACRFPLVSALLFIGDPNALLLLSSGKYVQRWAYHKTLCCDVNGHLCRSQLPVLLEFLYKSTG